MKLILTGGRVVDPASGLDDQRDVLIEDGRIVDLAAPGAAGPWAEDAETHDVSGFCVTPGLIDIHTHLREPGEEYKETVATGLAAAAAGGFTAVAAMPNTKPVNDQRSVTELILDRAETAGLGRVYPVAAMTKGQDGAEICEYGDLVEAGAVAVSDDGRWVQNGLVMRRVLEYAKSFGLTAITHAQDPDLSQGGVMNEGPVATRLGLKGQPAVAEETALFRDIRLAALTGQPLHVAHVSTAGSVALLLWAKERGWPVTAETAPHYFTLTDQAVEGYRTEAKMNPPLRSPADVSAVRQALSEGIIDAVATDHAPHSVLEKELEFERAAFGIIGLETVLPLTLELVRQGVVDLSRAVAMLTATPADILGVPGGRLAPNLPADVTVIDLDRIWVCEPAALKSKSRNTPFAGWELTGQAVMTLVAGRVVHHR
jgi:dihydroorotase